MPHDSILVSAPEALARLLAEHLDDSAHSATYRQLSETIPSCFLVRALDLVQTGEPKMLADLPSAARFFLVLGLLLDGQR